MDIKLKINEEQARELLRSYKNWTTDEYAQNTRDTGTYIKENILDLEMLNNAADEDIISNIYDNYVLKLDGPVYRTATKEVISNNLDAIKKNLIFLIGSDIDCFEKAEKILDGEYKIRGLSKSFWTPIFQEVCPNILPIWNNKTEVFFDKVGISLNTNKLSTIQKYKVISDTFLYFMNLDDLLDFYFINHLMHYGTAIKEGSDLIEDFMIFNNLINFLNQASTTDLTTTQYKMNYRDFVVRTSFGQGVASKVPWIGFESGDMQGFNVSYLYFREKKTLILAYNISENNPPVDGVGWQFDGDKPQSIEKYFQIKFGESSPKYGTSFIYKTYNINNADELNIDIVKKDLNDIILEYKKQLNLINNSKKLGFFKEIQIDLKF